MAEYAPVQETLAPAAGPPIDPDVLEQRRKLAQALIAQAMGGEPIGSWTQGVANLAQALMGGYTVRKANEQEAAGRASGAADTAAALAEIAAMGGGTADLPGTEAVSAPPGGDLENFLAGGARGNAGYVYNGMLKRGASPAAAAAFAASMQQESGFNPNAYNPGEGAISGIQWRGPRAAGLKAFAAKQGKKWNTLDTNMDYAVHEMQTTEAAAGRAFFAAKTPEEANRALKQYIRYGDKAGPAGSAGWDYRKRLGNTRRILNMQGGGGGETAALPGVQPVSDAPTPDVAAFLGQGTGTRPTVPGGPAEMMTPAPIGRGATAAPVAGTPMPTRPTVTGYPAIAAALQAPPANYDPVTMPRPVPPPDAMGRITPATSGPYAMPQPIPQGGHVLMAQQPPAPLPQDRNLAAIDPSQVPFSIDSSAALAPVAVPPQSPSDRAVQAVVQAQGRTDVPPVAPPAPIIGRTPAPIQPPAAPVARTPAPRPAPAVAAATPASTASIPQAQPRRQIFREPYPGAPLSAQEFARQGQNYLTGRGSFADQTPRVAPRTMQEPIAGAPGGAPVAAAPAQPRRGLLDALFGRGAPGGPGAAQAVPAGSPAAAGATAAPADSPLARLMANPYVDPTIKAAVFARAYPKAQEPFTLSPGQVRYGPNGRPISSVPAAPPDPYTLSPGQTRYGPNGQPLASVPATPEKPPSAVQEYEYAKGQGFKGTFEQWEASKKGGMSLIVNPETGEVTFQQGSNIKPLTEAQSKDTVYATRAQGALAKLDKYGNALTNFGQSVASGAGTLGNYMKTPEYQQAEQAGREFLQAILRKDTGAAITAGEMDSYGKTYLPGPGDSPELLAQKQQSRTRALEALKAGMTPQAILNQEMALKKTGEASPNRTEGSKPRARNPQTGAEVEWNGSEWVPVQ